jgi:hypothetical protein
MGARWMRSDGGGAGVLERGPREGGGGAARQSSDARSAGRCAGVGHAISATTAPAAAGATHSAARTPCGRRCALKSQSMVASWSTRRNDRPGEFRRAPARRAWVRRRQRRGSRLAARERHVFAALELPEQRPSGHAKRARLSHVQLPLRPQPSSQPRCPGAAPQRQAACERSSSGREGGGRALRAADRGGLPLPPPLVLSGHAASLTPY